MRKKSTTILRLYKKFVYLQCLTLMSYLQVGRKDVETYILKSVLALCS